MAWFADRGQTVGAQRARAPLTSIMAAVGSTGAIDRRSDSGGLQRISEANLKHGRRTKDKLAAQRHTAEVGHQVMGELKRIERQFMDAGLMPDDRSSVQADDFWRSLQIFEGVLCCHSEKLGGTNGTSSLSDNTA